MLCEFCKKNPATLHVVKIVNNMKQEMNICKSCAENMEGFDLGSDFGFSSPFSFQNILGGIMDYVNQANQGMKANEPVCKNCGTNYSEFKNKGLLGCSECYANFSSTLTPIIKRIQGNVEHTGKIPKKCGKEIIEKKRLMKLKEDLQKAIASEEYENAAKIRDSIREFQNNGEGKEVK